MFDVSTIIVPGIIVGVILLLVLGLLSMWKRVPQDKAVGCYRP